MKIGVLNISAVGSNSKDRSLSAMSAFKYIFEDKCQGGTLYQTAFRFQSKLKSIVPHELRRSLGRLWVVRWLRLWFKYHFLLKQKLRAQLRLYSEAQTQTPGYGIRILVPLIESSHYQLFQILILAKALALRGAEIKVLLCGSRLDGCENKNVGNQEDPKPCLKCRFNHRAVVPHFNLPIAQLSDFITEDEVASMCSVVDEIAKHYPRKYLYHGIDLIPIVNDSVTRYYYGAVPEDNLAELEVRRRQHLLSAMIGAKVARRLHEEWGPDVVLTNMQTYSPWAPYFEYFTNQGVQFSSINYSIFDYHCVTYNLMEHFHSNHRYRRFLEYRCHRMLDDEEKSELYRIVDTRFSGALSIFKDGDWFGANAKISEILHIDPVKRNIFLPSNLVWDKGLSGTGGLFDDMIDWVLKTIELTRDRSDIHLYIKPHPAERMFGPASAKGMADFVRMRYPVLPENVTLVMPELKVSPYELLPFMDVGVLSRGTLGLEMMLVGMAVIATGQPPYRGLGFAFEPATLDEYRDALLGVSEIPKPPLDEVELFAYFYFIKTMLPWTLTHQAYADNFKGYTFNSLDDIMPGKDKYLDHICNCILDSENTIVEGWE